MSQQTFDPHFLNIISHTEKRLPPIITIKHLADNCWQLSDGAVLHFEQHQETFFLILQMPEKHLDLHQLTQLLMLGAQGWPVPLAVSLNSNEVQALLFTRMRMAALDIDPLLQMILALLHARKRWLQIPPAITAVPRDRPGTMS